MSAIAILRLDPVLLRSAWRALCLALTDVDPDVGPRDPGDARSQLVANLEGSLSDMEALRQVALRGEEVPLRELAESVARLAIYAARADELSAESGRRSLSPELGRLGAELHAAAPEMAATPLYRTIRFTARVLSEAAAALILRRAPADRRLRRAARSFGARAQRGLSDDLELIEAMLEIAWVEIELSHRIAQAPRPGLAALAPPDPSAVFCPLGALPGPRPAPPAARPAGEHEGAAWEVAWRAA